MIALLCSSPSSPLELWTISKVGRNAPMQTLLLGDCFCLSGRIAYCVSAVKWLLVLRCQSSFPAEADFFWGVRIVSYNYQRCSFWECIPAAPARVALSLNVTCSPIPGAGSHLGLAWSHVCPPLLFPIPATWYLSPATRWANTLFVSLWLCPFLCFYLLTPPPTSPSVRWGRSVKYWTHSGNFFCFFRKYWQNLDRFWAEKQSCL